jgi:hypothetical protein
MTRRPVRLTSALRAAAVAMVLAGALACGGADVTGTAGRGTGTSGGGTDGGTTTGDARLVGRWSRTVYFYDEYGSLNSSRTEWTFAADGAAARTVTATNWDLGLSDAVVALARWSTAGNEIVIAYQPPDAGTVRFAFRFESTIDGPMLWLGEAGFFRLTP